jgi:replicative DNA helicase
MELYNTEAEQILLGSIIYNNNYLNKIDDFFDKEHFSSIEHKVIFEEILALNKQGFIADMVSLRPFFKENLILKEVGSLDYLNSLLAVASSHVEIREYALIITELWKKRELENCINDVKEALSTNTLDFAINKIENAVKKIDVNINSVQLFDGEEALNDWYLEKDKQKVIQPIPTNIESLNKMLNGGLHKEGLYVFGAGSGTGKTFFAQNIILNALKLDYGVLFVSMEMSKRKIIARFLSILSRINSFRILINNIYNHEENDFNFALETWKSFQKKFFIVEKVSLSTKEIEFALKKALKKNPIDLIVIDYAQIMKLNLDKNFNESSLIKQNVNFLAKIAQRYKVPVFLLSQLTKDKIGDKVSLSSLKGSGGLYEDADCVIAMWNDTTNQSSNTKNKVLQMEVLKNRDGLSDSVSINFNGDIGEFKEIKL